MFTGHRQVRRLPGVAGMQPARGPSEQMADQFPLSRCSREHQKHY